jgi:site-specific DNA-methyltransferase (adenine-specific)
MNLGEARQQAFRNGFKGAADQAEHPWRIGDGLPANQVIRGNSIELLNELPEGWVDLVFADPPFNIGYLYHNYEDRKSDKDYLDFSTDWMRAVWRALRPGGSFYLAIGDEFAADLAVIARRTIGFSMRNWIIWHYTFGQQTKKKFARSHTHIFYFTKGDDAKAITFNADAVRVASARQTVYADSRANSKGKLPDDTWFLRPQVAATEAGYFPSDCDTWNISRICGTFNEREGWHGCQMPIAVLDRIIAASSGPGDVVLDPFNGSGTTCVSAARLGRKFVGIDQSEEYVAYARKRIEHALEIHANGNGHVHAKTRQSKVKTQTDAFGRPRVERKKRAPAVRRSA